MTRLRSRAGRWLSVVLIVLGGLSLVVADFSYYAERKVFDAHEFADRGASSLSDRAVRVELGNRIVNRAVRIAPDLNNLRPVLEVTADGVVDSAAFQGLLRSGLRDVHRSILGRDRDTATLRIADTGVLLASALNAFAPRVGKRVPDGLDVRLLSLTNADAGGFAADVAQHADRNSRRLHLAVVVMLLCFVAAAVVAPDRRRACWRIAIAVAAAAAMVAIGVLAARSALAGLGNSPEASAAIRGVWEAYFGDLRDLNLLLAGAGLVAAAAIAAPVRPFAPSTVLRRARAAAVAVPVEPWKRTLRALALIVLGVLVVAAADTVLTLAVYLLGAGIAYVGSAELLRLAVPAGGVDRLALSLPGRPAVGRRTAVAALVAVALIGAGALALVALADPERPPFSLRACNGSARLCGRPLDRVVFPSTHNSMGATSEPGWLFASQEDGIPQQLDAGVRGLFIDTHYGIRRPRGVYTVLDRGSKSRGKIEEAVGPKFVAAAQAIRRRIGHGDEGKREVYLCHAFCEVGATKAEVSLARVRDFLVAHPSEVIVIGIEDEVSPGDTEKLFRRSGLLDLVYRGSLRPMPTLRELIDDGGRVIVMSERLGGASWLRRQFDITQETPYSFPSLGALESPRSCAPSRGRPSNPLFLLNHWVDSTPAPRVGNARRANSRRFLLARARRCERMRGRLPNFLSVDLYRQGDLFDVTRRLNRQRVRTPAP